MNNYVIDSDFTVFIEHCNKILMQLSSFLHRSRNSFSLPGIDRGLVPLALTLRQRPQTGFPNEPKVVVGSFNVFNGPGRIFVHFRKFLSF